ncbi:hypothetical protein N665_0110s0004 [Sinapis alba]|nr:hypothetical protein N665_0110s0004 [Sinapis alba]
MAKTKGGRQVGYRRSRRNQGLEATATTLKKVAAQADKVEDVTPQVVILPNSNGAVEVELINMIDDALREDDVEEDKRNDNEADQAEKAVSEDDKDSEKEGEACLTGQEQKEDEEDAANMEGDGEQVQKENDNGNEKEADNMEQDGVSNANSDEIPSTEGFQLPEDE